MKISEVLKQLFGKSEEEKKDRLSKLFHLVIGSTLIKDRNNFSEKEQVRKQPSQIAKGAKVERMGNTALATSADVGTAKSGQQQHQGTVFIPGKLATAQPSTTLKMSGKTKTKRTIGGKYAGSNTAIGVK